MRCSVNIYSPALHGKRQGSVCHDYGWRIDPSSCSDACSVDNMSVWWFRAACFHGLKYLCVNREVLKQIFIMRTEMVSGSAFLEEGELLDCDSDESGRHSKPSRNVLLLS